MCQHKIYADWVWATRLEGKIPT